MRKFIRKWLALARAVIAVSKSTGEPAPPPVLPSTSFDFARNSRLYDLMQDPGFVDILRAIGADEKPKLVEYLRDLVRSERHMEAARTEAALQVFEDLPKIFERYAMVYLQSRQRTAKV